jgi:hypothetical protein
MYYIISWFNPINFDEFTHYYIKFLGKITTNFYFNCFITSKAVKVFPVPIE